MQVQHQTSTHAGNILSSYGNSCKLDPCPSVCYLHVLTKAQGKGTWALPEILPRLWTTIWQRKAVWKTLFKNKSSRTINPVYLPRKLLNTTKNVSINKTLSITTHAQYVLSCNLGGTSHEQQWPSSCSVLEIMQWKEMHQLLHRTWGGMILKGIFLSNFWSLYMLENNLRLNWGMYAEGCSPCGVDAPILAWSEAVHCLAGLGRYLVTPNLSEIPNHAIEIMHKDVAMSSHELNKKNDRSWKKCIGTNSCRCCASQFEGLGNETPRNMYDAKSSVGMSFIQRRIPPEKFVRLQNGLSSVRDDDVKQFVHLSRFASPLCTLRQHEGNFPKLVNLQSKWFCVDGHFHHTKRSGNVGRSVPINARWSHNPVTTVQDLPLYCPCSIHLGSHLAPFWFIRQCASALQTGKVTRKSFVGFLKRFDTSLSHVPQLEMSLFQCQQVPHGCLKVSPILLCLRSTAERLSILHCQFTASAPSFPNTILVLVGRKFFFARLYACLPLLLSQACSSFYSAMSTWWGWRNSRNNLTHGKELSRKMCRNSQDLPEECWRH